MPSTGAPERVELLLQRGDLERAAALAADARPASRPTGSRGRPAPGAASQSCIVPVAWACSIDLVGEVLGDERRAPRLGTPRCRRRRRSRAWRRRPVARSGRRRRSPAQLGHLGVEVDGSSAGEARRLGPLHVEVDGVLDHEAVAAVHVQAPRGRRLGLLAAVRQRRRRQPAVAVVGGVDGPGRLEGEEPGAVDGGVQRRRGGAGWSGSCRWARRTGGGPCVLHPDVERLAGQAGLPGRGQCPPERRGRRRRRRCHR